MRTLILLTTLLAGCAGRPLTPFQQQLLLIQASHPYQLPLPPRMAPVNQGVTCSTVGNVTQCQ